MPSGSLMQYSQYFTLAYELSSFPWLYITPPLISV
jgi:hypothetical protein